MRVVAPWTSQHLSLALVATAWSSRCTAIYVTPSHFLNTWSSNYTVCFLWRLMYWLRCHCIIFTLIAVFWRWRPVQPRTRFFHSRIEKLWQVLCYTPIYKSCELCGDRLWPHSFISWISLLHIRNSAFLLSLGLKQVVAAVGMMCPTWRFNGIVRKKKKKVSLGKLKLNDWSKGLLQNDGSLKSGIWSSINCICLHEVVKFLQ